MSIKTLKLIANSKAARTKDPVKRGGGEKQGKGEEEDSRLNSGLSTHTIHKETKHTKIQTNMPIIRGGGGKELNWI